MLLSSVGWSGKTIVLLTALGSLINPSLAVKRENFKTCDQSGFCKRNRLFADTVTELGSQWKSPYTLDAKTIQLKDGKLSGIVIKSIFGTEEQIRLPLTVSFQESGTARVTLDEERRQKGDIELRHDSKARKERYNEVEKWAIVGGLQRNKAAAIDAAAGEGVTVVKYGPAGTFEAVITHSPLAIDFKRDGKIQVQLSERGLLSMEHWRQKIEKHAPPETTETTEGETPVPTQETEPDTPQYDESTWWDESFGGNTDSKPRGPESVGLDITFPGYEHVFGIPSHATPLSLRETKGGDGKYSEPYRLYNADVFEYEMDSPMTLYGAIPFMQAHKKDSTVGVFWLNAAETWVDIVKPHTGANPLSLGVASTTNTKTHWFSESGLIDVFVFLGPTPQDVIGKYAELTGYTALPQSFAIAYHQCRWNYVSDQDVLEVDRKFDKAMIPYDVIWLDIEYTQEKKYFTWDPLTFPNPKDMHTKLDETERKLVAIIDPHIKNTNDYPVVDELKSKDLAVHNKDGNIYEGWCWPGSSHWVDCFNPSAIEWWKSLYKYDKWIGTAPNTFLWNDMNEPSVFNGPETTMPKDNLHHGNWEHRDVHNLNGMTLVNASYHALKSRKKGENRRPFVLTRSFYSGTQRMGAMWTGDNQANWDHLAASIAMVLSQGIAGFPFAGADVGGFFGNPEKDLLTRWYQAGIFYPFLRAHAHIDTRRREPYLAGEPYTEIISQALRLRYSLLPAWYTAFHEASVNGTPIIRPNYYVHPGDEKGFAIDDQLYLGSTGLLAKPVVTQGAESVDIYIADNEPYYDYFDYTIYYGPGTKTIPAPLEKIPLLMQGGNIIPRRDRPRRSSGLMRYDPFALVVVLSKTGNANGTLYLDDGDSFEYQQGAYIHRAFSFDWATQALTSVDLNPTPTAKKTQAYLKTMAKVEVEQIIIVGAPKEWKSYSQVFISEEGAKASAPRTTADIRYVQGESGKGSYAVIRKPGLPIGKGWKVSFEAVKS